MNGETMISVPGAKFSKSKSKSAPFFITLLISVCTFVASAKTAASAATPAKTEIKTELNTEKAANTFVTLCYHDVSTGFLGDIYSVRKKDLIEQFDYLKAHYNVVGLQDILDAAAGKKNLPPKAVLLTFDDGLASFYENVYPLLKSYKFKSIFSIVGSWTEAGAAPDYGFKDSNPKMATWKQIKEMANSSLVDVASHSYDLHESHVYNPQGSVAPRGGFFKYDGTTKSYETDEAFTNRIQADLQKNNDLIKKHLGKTIPVMTWPYGAYSSLSIKAAENAGLKMQLTLRAGLTHVDDLSIIRRGLVLSSMEIPQFAAVLEKAFVVQVPLRMTRVDLDSIWKKSEAETEQVLGDLLEQTLSLGTNAALVQAVSTSGDAYFATASLPVRGDYLNRVVHTLRSRARVEYVYARLPQSFLKNPETATGALRDLVKLTDIDGVFFDVSDKDKLDELPFASLMAAARAVRPHVQFGVIGQKPANAKLFDYVMLSAPQMEKEKASLSSPEWLPQQLIVDLPKEYKLDAAHVMSQGYLNLFYDVNFNGIVADTDFKNLFFVRPVLAEAHKGEAK
jgi:biofilm PGA synthesis lipoprotein PgaB